MTSYEPNDFLKLQLSHFGLNPKDWSLVPETANKFWIINSHDPGLRLIGVTTSEPTFSWERLSIPEL